MFRPAINNDDNYLSKIIKYIPAEVIAVYTAVVGVLKPENSSSTPDTHVYIILLLIIIGLTPIWTYLAVLDNTDIKEPPPKKKRAAFHAAIATISFCIWLFAIGDELFISWWCRNAEAGKCTYSAKFSSLILILYTGLFVPLLERLVLGKSVPPTPLNKQSLTDPVAQKIIDECQAQFEAYKSDCSGFAKAVANSFAINFTGKADDIVEQIQSKEWTQLKDGIAAKTKADAGWFVVAGLKSSNHTPPRNNGHVAIVVSGPLANDKYPTGYWGTLGGTGMKNTTLNYAWNTADRDHVIYWAKKVS